MRYYNPHESALRSLFRWRFTLTCLDFVGALEGKDLDDTLLQQKHDRSINGTCIT